ncbi:MAG: TolC family protein [Deltaproteobacteria bacterium]|nr:TolC family protein [Deltaproteobacteria bacterium]
MRIEHLVRSAVLWISVGIALSTAAVSAEGASAMNLQESIDLALKQSVLLHAAKEGVKGAEAQQKEAFTAFLPKFSTSYSFTRLNEEPFFNFPGAPPLIPAGEIKTGTKENYNWVVEARQPLFAGGGIVANYEANRLGTEIARFDEASTVQDLVQEVKVAYFNILKADRILSAARQSLDRLTAHRETAQSFFDVGVIPKNDLLYAEVELANGRQALVRAENGLEMAKSKFNTLLRREINTPVEIEDILDGDPFGSGLDDCIAAALANRPEIRSYALRWEQAKRLVGLARSEYYPSVGLVGNYAKYGDTPGLGGSPYKDQENWYVMAVANWNFWEWGKTKNRVDAGLSRENQASDVLVNLRDQITLEVKNAYLLLREAEKQVQVSKKAIEQAEENFRINTERYREQVGTSTDVIDAQTLLTRANSDYFNALGDFSISRARLERAMGAGR